jgi:ATP-dependent Clp protease ATP-binding subunit ClpA
VLNAAEQMALSLEHPVVGIGHLLLALARERRGVTSDILERSGLEPAALEKALNRRELLPLMSIEPVIEEAVERAEKLGSHYVGADHLLLTLTLLPMGVTLLLSYGAAPDRVNRLLNKHLKGD